MNNQDIEMTLELGKTLASQILTCMLDDAEVTTARHWYEDEGLWLRLPADHEEVTFALDDELGTWLGMKIAEVREEMERVQATAAAVADRETSAAVANATRLAAQEIQKKREEEGK